LSIGLSLGRFLVLEELDEREKIVLKSKMGEAVAVAMDGHS